jgi:hypothetical protein
MITLTVIVLAMALGWGVIQLWSRMAAAPCATPAPEAAEQLPVR